MDNLKKYGLIVAVCFAIFIALIVFSLNIPRSREANFLERVVLGIVSPVMEPVTEVGRFCGGIWSDYIDLVDVRRQNRELVREIKNLNTRLVAQNEELLQNRRLTRLLEMKEALKAPSLTASVVGEDLSSWFRTLVIDRGSSSGLKEGMAVTAADGVVGQIIKVAPESARVLLLTDHASGISATIQRSRARGVVKGKGEGLCSLEFTTREEDVKVGDQVVSSGIGGVFMKGLPIGEVTMVRRGEYGIFQTVTIRPAVNSDHLEEVLVILRGGI